MNSKPGAAPSVSAGDGYLNSKPHLIGSKGNQTRHVWVLTAKGEANKLKRKKN